MTAATERINLLTTGQSRFFQLLPLKTSSFLSSLDKDERINELVFVGTNALLIQLLLLLLLCDS
jgi:hypothetical protein